MNVSRGRTCDSITYLPVRYRHFLCVIIENSNKVFVHKDLSKMKRETLGVSGEAGGVQITVL